VSRRFNALACAPALYARLSFRNLTLTREGQPRVVDDAVLATLCRRAGASLRYLNVRRSVCRRITPAGLDAALQGVDRSVLRLRTLARHRPLGSDGFRGVVMDTQRGRYKAHIRDEAGRMRSLGIHATAEEAARAYDARARQLGRPAAQLNFPPWQ
jgi:hypothetical protein